MRMTISARLVAHEILRIAQPPFTKDECEQVALQYLDKIPDVSVGGISVEEADDLAKQVIDFTKSLANVRVGAQLYGAKMWVVVGIVIGALNQLHLAMEQLLFNMGVVNARDDTTEGND